MIGHEVDQSSHSDAKFKIVWSCTSAPHVCLHGVDRNSIPFFTAVHEYWTEDKVPY